MPVAERTPRRADASWPSPRAPGSLACSARPGRSSSTAGRPPTPRRPSCSRPCGRPGRARSCCCPTTATPRAWPGQPPLPPAIEGFTVAVVPTRSTVQGLAALAVFDEARSFDDDVAAMAAAAGSTRWAEVTKAVREAMTMAGVCRPGDVLGLIEGDVVLIGDDVEAVAQELVDRMLAGGGELVTLVSGQDAPDGLAERLSSYVDKTPPGGGGARPGRRPAALPAPARRRVSGRAGHAARQGARRQDRQGPGDHARPEDGRRPPAPLPAPLREAWRADRLRRAAGRRARDGLRGCSHEVPRPASSRPKLLPRST